MFCQTTAGGGSSKRLARGSTPSTPDGDHRRRKRKEKRTLSELMFFRCTPEDKAIIEANAENTGLEKSAYMRVQSTGKPVMRACRRIRADWDELRRCLGTINKAGNVLNQLVVVLRRIEVSPDLTRAALAELMEAARMVMELLREI